MKSYGVTIQMKTLQQYFHMELLSYYKLADLLAILKKSDII